MSLPSDDWLVQVNRELRESDVAPRQRPWAAWRRWATETGLPSTLESAAVKRIFRWFEANTQAGNQLVGPMYVGAFYFDASIWPVVVPVVYGTVALNPFDSLKGAPDLVVRDLARAQAAARAYVETFADCIDFGMRAPDVLQQLSDGSLERELFAGAVRALHSCVELLLIKQPNAKSLELARDAVEIFLKSYLVALHGYDEARLKAIGHNLARCLAECERVAPGSELASVGPHLPTLPEIVERYKASSRSPGEMWQGYRIAQFVGATVVRLITGEDVRRSFRYA